VEQAAAQQAALKAEQEQTAWREQKEDDDCLMQSMILTQKFYPDQAPSQ
jgi:hypothetical protein